MSCDGSLKFLLNLHRVEINEGGNCALPPLWSWVEWGINIRVDGWNRPVHSGNPQGLDIVRNGEW